MLRDGLRINLYRYLLGRPSEAAVSLRFHPDRGAVVTYIDRETSTRTVFRRAVALGPELTDPNTDDTWIPVVRSDHETVLVDPTVVVDVRPAGCDVDERPAAAEVVEVTRRALGTAIRELDAGGGPESVQILLADFVAAISPVQRTLEVLGDMEPTGLVAVAITYLVNASTQLDIGNVVAGRAAIEAAYVVFQDLAADPD